MELTAELRGFELITAARCIFNSLYAAFKLKTNNLCLNKNRKELY